jgi:hypothetical protein
MNSSMKKKSDNDHEYEEDVYDLIPMPNTSVQEPNVKFARLVYGNNQEILFNIQTQVKIIKFLFELNFI